MSAFVVSAAHIATCAQIIREIVFHYHDDPPSDESIRIDLAMANVISVAYRYGPEGELANQPMFDTILGNLSDSGWDTTNAALPAGTSDVNEACFDDGYTVTDYLADCRSAEAVHYTPAEAVQYLSCLNYQSCEAPDWEDTKVRRWILESQSYLAGKLARIVLGERHVWEVRETESVLVAI